MSRLSNDEIRAMLPPQPNDVLVLGDKKVHVDFINDNQVYMRQFARNGDIGEFRMAIRMTIADFCRQAVEEGLDEYWRREQAER